MIKPDSAPSYQNKARDDDVNAAIISILGNLNRTF